MCGASAVGGAPFFFGVEVKKQKAHRKYFYATQSTLTVDGAR